jgi:hypothetical protein
MAPAQNEWETISPVHSTGLVDDHLLDVGGGVFYSFMVGVQRKKRLLHDFLGEFG